MITDDDDVIDCDVDECDDDDYDDSDWVLSPPRLIAWFDWEIMIWYRKE